MAVHMDCPRCGGQATPDVVCEFCGINMPLYEKAVYMSDLYYDKGLRFAKVRDLTSAVECLKSSLQINKKNTKARNLLGLCYHVMGRIGEALREWVISANYDDSLAREYLDVFQENLVGLERYSEGLRNYNEALVFMHQYSEDLAAIRLKRAVEIIPNFVAAMNLLALFHIKTGENQKAAALVERVLAIDAENPFAKRYYREIFNKKVPTVQKIKLQTPENNKDSPLDVQKNGNRLPFGVQSKKLSGRFSSISGILLFLAGLGIMFLFMFFLVLPSSLQDVRDDAYLRETELLSDLVAAHASIEQRDEAAASLEQELVNYQGTAAQRADRITILENENWVNMAYIYLSRGYPHEAVRVLENAQEVFRLSLDVRNTYDFIIQTAFPIVEADYYTRGLDYFNSDYFAEARAALERATYYIIDDSVNAPHIFYFLGRIAEVEEDFDMARRYLERVIIEFPDSNRVNSAAGRLENMP